MNRRPIVSVRGILAAICLLAGLDAPADVRGEGSISFNGGEIDPDDATSKIQNNDADVLDGQHEITLCVWLYANGPGEGARTHGGGVFYLDENGASVFLQHSSSANQILWYSNFTTGGSKQWQFPFADDGWRPVSLTYDKSSSSNVPAVRVNFSNVTVSSAGGSGSEAPVTVPAGYCVGNYSPQTHTWDGKIAHLQVFKRILSAGEQDQALRTPGSVTDGLRLWLKMQNEDDTFDFSGHGFNGVGTDLGTGNDGPVLTNPFGVPEGIKFVPAGIHTVPQEVIPRYAVGSSHPAGQLRGVGPASVVRGNEETGDKPTTPIDTRAVVITEDFGQNISFWQAGNAGLLPAVLQPQLRDLTICGYADAGAGDDYTGQGICDKQPGLYQKKTYGIGTLTGSITAAASSGGVITVTSPAHGAVTGQQVQISGVPSPMQAANGKFRITLADPDGGGSLTAADGFTLDGSSAASGSSMGGTWTSLGVTNPSEGETIVGATNANPIVITTNLEHGLTSGDVVTITGVQGNTAANTTALATVLSDTTFSIPVAGNGTYTFGGTFDSVIVMHSYRHSLPTGAIISITGVGGNTNANVTNHTITKVSDNSFALNGRLGNGNYTSGGTWTSEYWKDREHGALLMGSGTQVEYVNFFYIPGTALVLRAGTGASTGQLLPFNHEKTRLWNCQFRRCYRGPQIGVNDAVLGKIVCEGLRDHGVQIGIPGITGVGVQFDGYLHIYGVDPGQCLLILSNCGACQGAGPFYLENAPIGLQIENQSNLLSNIHSHSCWDRNIYLAGSYNRLNALDIKVYAGVAGIGTGIYFQAFHNSFADGRIYLEYGAGTGIYLFPTEGVHNGARIDNFLIQGTGASQGTGIKTTGTINDCYIRVHFKNIGTGLDFSSGGAFGDRNTIYVTSDGPYTDLVLFPASWNASNDITVNGMKVKGRITSAVNNGSGDWRVSSTNHGLVTGDKIAIDGARGAAGLGSSSYGHVRQVTIVDSNTFDVDNTDVSGTHEANTGWWGVWQK